ncbi:MAG: NADH-quinone oxidoreductase subunit K [candidate division KSB1 bacterium]|nr:NADH-quinone oxidoreductase subunit K [candidate division KSB1 bacterium]
MTEQTLVVLTLAFLIVSIFTVELRNLRVTVFFYWMHSVLLFLTIGAYAYVMKNPSLYFWCATVFLFKMVIIPTLMATFLKRVPVYEFRPVLGFAVSLVIISAVEIVFFNLFRHYAYLLAPAGHYQQEPTRSLLAGAFTVFTLGLYALLTRRDALKTVIGLALMENGVHLVLLALASQLPETTMIGILTDVVVVVGLLLYISTTIYEVFGFTDTARLSELRR